MAASQLPQEMIEAIIRHLHDDNQSLNACSLVCKAWMYPARLVLFAAFILRWPLQPAVFPFVRHLYIRMDAQHGSVVAWHKIIPMLTGFHRMISLELDLLEQSLNRISTSTWLALGKKFSGVVSLSLTRVRYDSAVSLARVICAFPCLQKLSLHGSTCFTSPAMLESGFACETTLRLPPDLDTLELGIGMDITLRWFLSLPVLPALRTLRLHQVPPDLIILPKFIGVFGNALQSLSLSAPEAVVLTHYSISITPLAHLRSLQFELCSGYRANKNRWVTQILSQISSEELEDVSFRMRSLFGGEVYSELSYPLEWSKVDAILQRSTFSRLRTVSFRCKRVSGLTSDGPLSSLVRTSIIQRLPRCAARGILRIEKW